MSEQAPGDDEGAEEPARPEIAPGLLRRMEEGLAGGGPAAALDTETVEGPDPAPAVPPASVEDPEMPGVPLDTRVEALLFLATEPLTLRRIKELVRLEDGRVVREAIDRLAARLANGAMRVEEVAGGFLLRTRPEVAPLASRLGRRIEAEKLSPAALETLAIVAYRQPVLRSDIEKIRGVASGEVLRALVERGLVRVAGRADLPGSPLYYGTTGRFLEVFGLRDLAELPRDAGGG